MKVRSLWIYPRIIYSGVSMHMQLMTAQVQYSVAIGDLLKAAIREWLYLS